MLCTQVLYCYLSCSPPAEEYLLWQDNVSFDSLFSHADLGHLGKGWIVRGTTNSLTWLTGSSTQAGTGGTNVQLIGSSVADCQALN